MMLTEAKKFHAYARECLQLAEQASEPDIRNGGRRSVHQLRQHAGPERSRQFRSDYRLDVFDEPLRINLADVDVKRGFGRTRIAPPQRRHGVPASH